ncbi:septal ring lytic transglycosylase RlpA family protein [Thermodesulfobacteriota bacterium]
MKKSREKFYSSAFFKSPSGSLLTSIAVLLTVISGCTHRTVGSRAVPRDVEHREFHGIYIEEGIASWYGKEFHGRPTASVETYDMYKVSAAHKILPLGTVVRVTDLEGGGEMVVTINDRGPYVEGRIIDLSYGAARELGLLDRGITRVRIESLAPVHILGRLTLQVGAFNNGKNAEALRESLTRRFPDVSVDHGDDGIFRVRVGSFSSEDEAEHTVRSLMREGHRVVRIWK